MHTHPYGLWVDPSANGQGLADSQPFSTAISAAATKAALNLKIPVGTNSVCACVCEGTSVMCNSVINHLPYGNLMNSIWTQLQIRGRTKTITPNYFILQNKKSISITIYISQHCCREQGDVLQQSYSISPTQLS